MMDRWAVKTVKDDVVIITSCSLHVVQGHLLAAKYGGGLRDGAPHDISHAWAPGQWVSFAPAEREAPQASVIAPPYQPGDEGWKA